MDGITGSPTLGGVVLATISGAAYAVFKVSFPCEFPFLSIVVSNKIVDLQFYAGDVSKSYRRSAGTDDRIRVHNNRFNKFNTLLANTIGSLFNRCGSDADGELILD